MSSSLDHIGFHCGDIVRHSEGRHTGTVVAIFNWTVRVKWHDTNWIGDEAPSDLTLVERKRRKV